jgi:hypothetical protein
MVEFIIGALIVLSVIALFLIPSYQNEADYHLRQQRKQKRSTEQPVLEGTPWGDRLSQDYAQKPNTVGEIKIRWIK